MQIKYYFSYIYQNISNGDDEDMRDEVVSSSAKSSLMVLSRHFAVHT